MEKYDLVCIGSGPAGILASVRAAKLYNRRCVVVDEEQHVGGCCVNEGCVPTKLMCFKTAQDGFMFDNTSLEALHQAKNAARDLQREAMRQLLQSNKVDLVFGKAKLAGPHQVSVDVYGNASASRTLNTEHVVVAVGAETASLPGITIDNVTVLSSTSCMELRVVPRRLAIVGAGAIGLELGSVWRRMGSQVTLIDAISHIGSPAADEQVAAEYQSLLESQGLRFVLNANVLGIDVHGSSSATVRCQLKSEDKEVPIECEKVLMAVGRHPLTHCLGLETVGVEIDGKGSIVVNEFGQSSVPSIFACGDCTAGPMVAHKGAAEAARLVDWICAGKKVTVNFDELPTVIYTQPEMAWVGKTEAQLRAEGKQLGPVRWLRFVGEMRNTLCPTMTGICKIVTEAGSGKILHVSFVSTTAGDMIAEAVLAVRLGAPIEAFGNVPHSHPVFKSLKTMLELDV